MPWREAMSTGGMKADATAAGIGALFSGGALAAFGEMTMPAMIIFIGVALVVFGRAALTWVRVCKEWRARNERK